jgi:hypothetical protein
VSSEANRAAWNAHADEYQRDKGPFLRGAAWGTWQIPEDELELLGGWPAERIWVCRRA